MASHAFKNLDEVMSYLEKTINTALDEMADEAIAWVQDEIQQTVYATYAPKEYIRKGENGGLTDPQNIMTNVNDKQLTIASIRMDDGKNVSYTVHSGSGYDYPVPERLLEGRPFITVLKEKMMRDKRHVNSMKKSLKRAGFEILK